MRRIPMPSDNSARHRKSAILRKTPVEHVRVPDLCDQHNLHPTVFPDDYKAFFENRQKPLKAGGSALALCPALKAKLRNKTDVLAESLRSWCDKKELGETRRTPVVLPLVAPGAQAGVVTACACRTSACVYQGPHINVPSHGFERDSMLMDKPARRCYPCSSDFFCTLAFRSCLTPSAADETSPFRCSTVSFSSFAAVPTSSLAF